MANLAASNEAPCRMIYPWTPDQGDGTYRNPILCADYSDPDVIRVGEDFYLTASSFNCTPGLPILKSRDLVNWTIINHALLQVPHPRYREVQHGCGVWAPAIRIHDARRRNLSHHRRRPRRQVDGSAARAGRQGVDRSLPAVG